MQVIIVKEKLGNINSIPIDNYDIDTLVIEWYEAKKRILHKQTKYSKEVAIKFLNKNPNLKDGDILWQDKNTIIAVEINPLLNSKILPKTSGRICYA